MDEHQRLLAGAECLHTAEEVEAAVDRMAEAIGARLRGTFPLLLGCMVGGHVPLAMLVQRLGFALEVDYVHATRYRGSTTGHAVEWLRAPPAAVAGRTVLVVDDLLDAGHTLAAVVARVRAMGAAEVLTAVLVEKDVDRSASLPHADFCALATADRWLVGYGMDCNGLLRNAPGIYALVPPT